MNILYIDGISKEEKNLTLINNLNLQLKKGQSIAIKCAEEIALLLIDIILGNILPTKGKVFIEETANHEYIKKHKNSIAVIYREEGFYDRLSVEEYLLFFKKVSDSKIALKEVMLRFGLLDITKNKIKTLTYSQKKRISFARSLISSPKILLIQEPTLNLDKESTLIIRESIPYINSLGISTLSFSVSLEDTILLESDSYTLDERGFNAIESDSDGDNNPLKSDENNIKDKTIDQSNTAGIEETERFSFKIDKIPVKINEKIVLLNPMDISYIEALEGVAYINVRLEKFPSSLTLTELEERLKYFGFFRCHRSYIVNLQMIKEVITWSRNSYSLILDDNDKSSIPLSKGKLEDLKQILNI